MTYIYQLSQYDSPKLDIDTIIFYNVLINKILPKLQNDINRIIKQLQLKINEQLKNYDQNTIVKQQYEQQQDSLQQIKKYFKDKYGYKIFFNGFLDLDFLLLGYDKIYKQLFKGTKLSKDQAMEVIDKLNQDFYFIRYTVRTTILQRLNDRYDYYFDDIDIVEVYTTQHNYKLRTKLKDYQGYDQYSKEQTLQYLVLLKNKILPRLQKQLIELARRYSPIIITTLKQDWQFMKRLRKYAREIKNK